MLSSSGNATKSIVGMKGPHNTTCCGTLGRYADHKVQWPRLPGPAESLAIPAAAFSLASLLCNDRSRLLSYLTALDRDILEGSSRRNVLASTLPSTH